MKRKRIHIVLSAMLIANLLFSQVAINLFHSDHPGQRSVADWKNGRVESKALVKHCKVCSLDIAFHLLFQPASFLAPTPSPTVFNFFYDEDVYLTVTNFLYGRAPPAVFI